MKITSDNIYRNVNMPLTEDYVAKVVNSFIDMSKNCEKYTKSCPKELYKVFYFFLKDEKNKGKNVYDSIIDLDDGMIKTSIANNKYTPFIDEMGIEMSDPIPAIQPNWHTYQSWHLSNHKKYRPEDISHRFYISIDPSTIPDFIMLLKEKFEKMDTTYYFKINDSSIVGNTQKDGLVIYSSTEDMNYVLSILKEIEIEYPELIKKCNDPHIFCGNINGWIGYANEIKKEKNSYTNLMSRIMYESIENSVLNWIRTHLTFTINENGKNIYLSEYFNSQIKSGKTEIELIKGLNEYIRKLGHLVATIPLVDKNFKQDMYRTIKNNLIKNNFNPNNICFNFDVLKEMNEYNSNIKFNKNQQSTPSNEHDYKAEYNELKNTRTVFPNLNENIINELKRKVWNYFKELTKVTNLEHNIQYRNVSVYAAPLLEIHGSNLVNWPVKNGNEIYIDKNFLKDPNNTNIIGCQVMHEMLHGLSEFKNEKQMFFGHGTECRGINEATTQMFAEDITGIRLSKDEDYMYFIKRVMRACKILVGEDKLASQYLNNDLSFEEKFNEISSGKFAEFANAMNMIYKLSMQNKYKGNVDLRGLRTAQNNVMRFIMNIIKKQASDNPEIIVEIMDELKLNEDEFDMDWNQLNSLSNPHK